MQKDLGHVGAKENTKRHELTWVTKEANWSHARASETAWKLGDTEASVARFLGVMTSSVNRMARQEEMTEVDTWDK